MTDFSGKPKQEEVKKETSPLLTPQTSVLDDDINYQPIDFSSELRTAGLIEPTATGLASNAAWLNGNAQYGNFTLIKDNLLSNGTSQEVEDIRRQIFTERENGDYQAYTNIISAQDTTADQKLEQIGMLEDNVANRGKMPIDDYIKYKIATAETVDNQLEAAGQSSVIELVKKEIAINEEIEMLINRHVAALDPSLSTAAGGFAAAMVPGFGMELKNAFAAADPEGYDFWMNVLPGEAMNAFTKRYQEADPDTKLNMVKAFLEASKKDGIWLDTDMSQADAAFALQSAIDPSAPSNYLMRSLYNLIGVADATFVGAPLAKLALKGLRPLARVPATSLLNKLNTYAPKKGAKATKAALEDPTGATAEALGTTRAAIASEQFPPASVESIPASPSVMEDLVITDPNAVSTRELLDSHGVGDAAYRFTDEEVAVVISTEEKARLAAAERAGVQVLNKTQTARLKDGVEVDTAISMTAKRGWPTLENAQTAAEAWVAAHPGATFHFFRKSNKGTYDPVEVSGTKSGLSQLDETDLGPNPFAGAELPPKHVDDYIFRIKDKVLYKASIQDPRPARVLPGWWSKWANVASQFGKNFVTTGFYSEVKAKALQAKLFDVQKAFRDLRDADRQAVIAVLRQEDNTGVQLNKAQVETALGTPARIKAYNAFRQTNYADYFVKNLALRAELESQGMKRLTSPFLDTYVAPLGKDAAAKVKYAVNAETGKMETLSEKSLADLYAKGGQLVSLGNNGVKAGTKQGKISYAIMRPGEDATLSELPTYVLRYLPGHITKNYNATHAVEMTYKEVVDGLPKESKKVLMMATGTQQAKQAAAEFSAKMAGDKSVVIIEPRLLREYQDRGYLERHGQEYYKDNNQLWFSKGRGNEIEHASGIREVTPVDEVMVRARQSAGRMAFLNPFIEDNITRYNVRYANDNGPFNFGVFNPYMPPKKPASDVVFKDGIEYNLTKEYNDALAYWHRFRLNIGMDDAWETNVQRKAMMWIGDKIIGTGHNTFRKDLGLAVVKHRDRGVTGTLSATAFATGIAFAPVRQLMLQVQSASVYAAIDHTIPYAASGRSFRDFETVLMGLATKYADNPVFWAGQRKRLARQLKTTEQEIDDLVDAAKDQISVINSHHFLDNISVDAMTVVGQSKAFRGAEHVFNVGKTAAYYGRKYGFSAGEAVNKLSAFLAVRNKHMINNPGKKWQDMMVDIVGETEARTGGMNDMGRTGWQTGIWRPLFQFSNYNARALQQLVPDVPIIGAISDKTWKNSERRKLALTQFAIYGVAGFGLMEGYETLKEKLGIENDKDAIIRPIMEEGFAGMAMDFIFRSLDAKGEEADLDFSGSFAPYAGALPISKGGRTSPYYGFAQSILESVGLMEPDTRSFIADAPGFSLLKRASKAASLAMTLAGTIPDEDFTTLEKWQVLGKIGLSMSPQYKNYLAGRLALKEGMVRDSSGRPVVSSTGGEAWARMLFGVKTEKERQYYNTKADILDRYGYTSVLSDKELGETAGDLHKNLMKITVLAAKDKIRPEVYERQVLEHMRYIKETHNPYEYEKIMRYFTEKKFSELTQSGEAKLNNLVVQILGDEDPDSSFSTKVMNFPDNWEQKPELVQIINTNRAEKQEALEQGK